MPPSPRRAREAVFSKAAEALKEDTAELAERWAQAFERRVAERGEPFPTDGLEADVEALVRGISEVLGEPWAYRSFLGEGEHQQIGRGIAEKHVQAGGTLTSALEAYMRLRQRLILASRERFRDSDRPFFDLMTRLNRCIDRVLFAIAEGYFSAFQAEIEKQAITDPLTGLGNSRRFREALSAELKRSDRTGRPFSVVFVDVDNFKDINDTLGHVEADYTLTAIGRTLVTHLRGSDLVCRWGGDEFIILLPETERAEAVGLAERLRAEVADCEKCAGATISLGVACFPQDGKDYDGLVAKADRALYASKHAGKNMVTQSTSGD
ncbi:MAG: GGDEF domain-containing protein [Gemmatimonadetes bacterium]|uniref:diguanylate cyclase n=1 Tax=Candidatus Kutchimonas denitrificans TaxID=3056748 RepID=A0AAE4Z6S3_9BACT|nr:GGDEF domain-containing protein [Gemmatimonadota bacterium]NIR74769.1 GGDEF domain-containing protein [Candidatus Kutchimonas denitrificans]NIS01519.1 GGDEF domain-containing protein [Gemmatimonadota bacterium]NIT67260.1 GGDEF domain-containing protein [Gemmatimonadota bacterium]NIU52434.1 diguanylate cyclase [Gemmatimonadota bacterium]